MATGLDVGAHQGYVRIVGEDSLPIDNHAVLHSRGKASLACARGSIAVRPIITRRTLSRRSRRPTSAAVATPVTTARLSTLPSWGGKPLESYAAVCLLDPPPLVENTWRQLADYARAGGGVGIFLGANVEQQFASFNTEAAQELLPGPLDFVARFPEGTNYLSTRNDQHPILAKFRSRRGSVPWEEFPIYRFWQFQSLQDGVGTVMALAGGQPALLEKPLGKGGVLSLITPVSELAEVAEDDRWNQLWGAERGRSLR